MTSTIYAKNGNYSEMAPAAAAFFPCDRCVALWLLARRWCATSSPPSVSLSVSWSNAFIAACRLGRMEVDSGIVPACKESLAFTFARALVLRPEIACTALGLIATASEQSEDDCPLPASSEFAVSLALSVSNPAAAPVPRAGRAAGLALNPGRSAFFRPSGRTVCVQNPGREWSKLYDWHGISNLRLSRRILRIRRKNNVCHQEQYSEFLASPDRSGGVNVFLHCNIAKRSSRSVCEDVKPFDFLSPNIRSQKKLFMSKALVDYRISGLNRSTLTIDVAVTLQKRKAYSCSLDYKVCRPSFLTASTKMKSASSTIYCSFSTHLAPFCIGAETSR